MLSYKYYVNKKNAGEIMANKFSDFNEEQRAQKKVEQIKSEHPEETKKVEDLMNKYSGLSEQQLMQEFIKESNKGKQNGTINKNYLNNIKSTLMPHLSNEQQANLKNLMDMIDE